MIPLRTGNLGVSQLKAAWSDQPLPDAAGERRKLTDWRDQGFTQVEDYVSWAVVEPRHGEFDWSLHRDHAAAAKAAGLDYVIYLWAHVAPRWYRDSDVFVPARCLEHRCASHFPSVFAAATWEAIERFYRAVAEGLGDVVDGVVVGFPADYGEVGLPCGVADWLFVAAGEPDHHHPGLWCDEPPARQRFADLVQGHYADARRLGEAWHLAPELAWTCPYPGIDATPRHRADFSLFYRGEVTRGADRLLALATRFFEGVSRELKIGHCNESLQLGVDLGGLVRVAARHEAMVRSTQSGMSELFTTRLASLCRTHGAAFGTEASREIGEQALALRVFADVAHGTTSYFEYPEQWRATSEAWAAARAALEAGPARRPVACFYPTADFAQQTGLGVLEDLHHCYPWLRRVADVDILDDEQVAEGALHGVRVLLWLDDVPVDDAALAALEGWLRDGGVLVYAAPGPPRDPSRSRSPVVLSDELRAALVPRRCALRYRHDGPPRLRVAPGEESSRLFLGAGWLGRENGAFAWPPAVPDEIVPARWTDGEAWLVLPRPSGTGLTLTLDLFVPTVVLPAEVAIHEGGQVARVVPVKGDGSVTVSVPMDGLGDADAVRLSIESGTYRPRLEGGSADLRDLGVLVRDVELFTDAAPRPADFAFTAHAEVQPERAREAVVPIGKGWVLAGDGTPLSAAAWLLAWLAGDVAGVAPSRVWRDERGHAFVTTFDGGALVHNPDALSAASCRLVGGGEPTEQQVEPLQTVWVEC